MEEGTGQRDELCVIREVVRDEFSNICAERCQGLRKILGDRRDGFSKMCEDRRAKIEKTDSFHNRSQNHANVLRKRTK